MEGICIESVEGEKKKGLKRIYFFKRKKYV